MNHDSFLLDTLPFLRRQDVEACLLICHEWRNYVEKETANLPLHRLELKLSPVKRSRTKFTHKGPSIRRFLYHWHQTPNQSAVEYAHGYIGTLLHKLATTKFLVTKEDHEVAEGTPRLTIELRRVGQGCWKVFCDVNPLLTSIMCEVLSYTRNAFIETIHEGTLPLTAATITAWEHALVGNAQTRFGHVVFSPLLHHAVPLKGLQQLTGTKLHAACTSLLVKECTTEEALSLLFSPYGPERVKFHYWTPSTRFLSSVVQYFIRLRTCFSGLGKSAEMESDSSLQNIWLDAFKRRILPCPQCYASRSPELVVDHYHFWNAHLRKRLAIGVCYYLHQYRVRVHRVQITFDEIQCLAASTSQRNRPQAGLARLPHELLKDVLQTLPRLELDVCQLVCKRLHRFINDYSPALPLRQLVSARLDRWAGWYYADQLYGQRQFGTMRKARDGTIRRFSRDSAHPVAPLRNCRVDQLTLIDRVIDNRLLRGLLQVIDKSKILYVDRLCLLGVRLDHLNAEKFTNVVVSRMAVKDLVWYNNHGPQWSLARPQNLSYLFVEPEFQRLQSVSIVLERSSMKQGLKWDAVAQFIFGASTCERLHVHHYAEAQPLVDKIVERFLSADAPLTMPRRIDISLSGSGLRELPLACIDAAFRYPNSAPCGSWDVYHFQNQRSQQWLSVCIKLPYRDSYVIQACKRQPLELSVSKN